MPGSNRYAGPHLERGQTTAEFVGVLVFVSLVVLVILAFRPEFAADVRGVMSSMLDGIRDK